MSNTEISRRSMLLGTGVAAGLGVLPRHAMADYVSHHSLQHNLERLADMRFGMFNHFNMGTFTGEEWATPNQDPKIFAPPSVNCAQWAAAAKAAKMKYGVLTTKHHDGFCLWPSQFNTYNVANSSYPQDIVSQYVEAFRAEGLKVGIYYSIWDRTYPVQAYGGHVTDPTQAIQPANITYILDQITELLTNYGHIDLWVNDGYAWQMGQQAVPYQQVRDLVKSLQPNIIMIDHGALSVPWLGDAIYFEEPLHVTSPANNTYASVQGTTITPAGWFWHPKDPATDPLSEADIISHLTDLEPKWTSFLLNCPPNRAGLLDDNIVSRLANVGEAWSPNAARPTLPIQQHRCEHPITPVSAYATGSHVGEGPLSAIDGRSDRNIETCWSTWPGQGVVSLPQSITVDLGGAYTDVSTLEYLPKQWARNNQTDGDITSYTISTSLDGLSFTEVAGGTWAADRTTKLAEWAPVAAAFVRLEALTGTGSYSNVSELRIGGRQVRPRLLRQRTFPQAGTLHRIVNANSLKALDLPSSQSTDGTGVVQNTVASTATQFWTFERDASGYFKIRNVATSKLLQIGNVSRSDGAPAQIWADASAPQEEWAVTRLGSDGVMLTNRFSSLSLNVEGASLADGAVVNQSEFNNVIQELWHLQPV